MYKIHLLAHTAQQHTTLTWEIILTNNDNKNQWLWKVENGNWWGDPTLSALAWHGAGKYHQKNLNIQANGMDYGGCGIRWYVSVQFSTYIFLFFPLTAFPINAVGCQTNRSSNVIEFHSNHIIILRYGQSLMLMMLWSSLTNPCKYIWMVNMLAMSFWIERNRGNRMAEQDATLFRGENNSIKRLFTISGLWKWRILIDDDIPSLTKGLTQIYYFARRNVCRRKSSKRADCKLTYLFYNLRTNGKRSEHGRGNIRSRTLYVFLHNINPT